MVIPDISAQQNWRRTCQQNIIAAEKNELTLLYSALLKKYLYAKLIVLCSMVTDYIWNMIAFLLCHYALSVNHYYKQVISA